MQWLAAEELTAQTAAAVPAVCLGASVGGALTQMMAAC